MRVGLAVAGRGGSSMFLGINLGMRHQKLHNTSMQHKQQNKIKQIKMFNSFLYFNDHVSPLLTVWCHMSPGPIASANTMRGTYVA
jgi:hypothetical protein